MYEPVPTTTTSALEEVEDEVDPPEDDAPEDAPDAPGDVDPDPVPALPVPEPPVPPLPAFAGDALAELPLDPVTSWPTATFTEATVPAMVEDKVALARDVSAELSCDCADVTDDWSESIWLVDAPEDWSLDSRAWAEERDALAESTDACSAVESNVARACPTATVCPGLTLTVVTRPLTPKFRFACVAGSMVPVVDTVCLIVAGRHVHGLGGERDARCRRGPGREPHADTRSGYEQHHNDETGDEQPPTGKPRRGIRVCWQDRQLCGLGDARTHGVKGPSAPVDGSCAPHGPSRTEHPFGHLSIRCGATVVCRRLA